MCSFRKRRPGFSSVGSNPTSSAYIRTGEYERMIFWIIFIVLTFFILYSLHTIMMSWTTYRIIKDADKRINERNQAFRMFGLE